MLVKNAQGHEMTWEESKPYLEAQGWVNREAFYQDWSQMHHRPEYTKERAAQFFGYLVQNHIRERTPKIYAVANFDRRSRTTYVSLHDEGFWLGDCALPDWMDKLYWEEIYLHVALRGQFPIGSYMYCARNDRVYKVASHDTVTPEEAADLEDANDVFGAAGTYSHLYQADDANEKPQVEAFKRSHQGIIGGVRPYQPGIRWITWYPHVLLPGVSEDRVFAVYSKNNRMGPVSQDGPGKFWDDKERAIAFLKQHFQEIRILDDWEEFDKLVASRF